MKVLYRQTASDDIVRQFRYYLLTADAPEVAVRFREAVRRQNSLRTENGAIPCREAVPSRPFTFKRRESLPGAPERYTWIYIWIYKDGGIGTFSRRYVCSD